MEERKFTAKGFNTDLEWLPMNPEVMDDSRLFDCWFEYSYEYSYFLKVLPLL